MAVRIHSVAAPVLAGILADHLLGDPEDHHPVAWFGSFVSAVERRIYGDSELRGAALWIVTAGTVAGVTAAAGRAAPRALRAAMLGTATWVALGGTTLTKVALRIERHLRDGELDQARAMLPWLVARDPQNLNEDEVARAAIESLAENTSDAVTAPIFWALTDGLGGVVLYRAANTLDAMIGYRNHRYERFGKPAALIDDALNIIPARLTALAICAAAPSVGGSPRAALHAWRDGAAHHPSPNGGPIEAATAGALGITLGGRNTYGNAADGRYSQDRGTLGTGPRATAADIPRAVRLLRTSTAVFVVGVGGALAGLSLLGRHAVSEQESK